MTGMADTLRQRIEGRLFALMREAADYTEDDPTFDHAKVRSEMATLLDAVMAEVQPDLAERDRLAAELAECRDRSAKRLGALHQRDMELLAYRKPQTAYERLQKAADKASRGAGALALRTLRTVRAECDAIEAEIHGQHDEDDDGMREAVRRIRAVIDTALDGPAAPTARTPCSQPDPCKDGELCDAHATEQAHAAGDHDYCDITCEAAMPSDQMRNFILAKGYPGTAGALNELLRRAAAGTSRPSAPAEEPQDTCRTIQVDGGPVHVRGAGEMTAEGRTYFAEVVQAAKRRYAAEHPDDDNQQPPTDPCGYCEMPGHDAEDCPNATR